MTTQIYYFSGTGNSLHVAAELQKKIPGAILTSMIDALNTNTFTSVGDVIGLVFPIYAFTVPIPVKQFLERVNLQSASYIFAIATRGGSPCRVFRDVDRIIGIKGAKLAATFYMNMPNNYILSFELPSQEDVSRLEAEMQKKLDAIQTVIINRKQQHESDREGHQPFLLFIFKQVVFPIMTFLVHLTGYFNMKNGFYADTKCTGCGVCQKVCPAERIAMNDDKPEWQKRVRCFFCLACLHYCPVGAVQIKKTKTLIKGRYHHPQVSAIDIARQKGLDIRQ